MAFHTVAVDFMPADVIGAGMRRVAGMLAAGALVVGRRRLPAPARDTHSVPPPTTAGKISTLPPLTYCLDAAAAALRQLSAARHVGKIVVTEGRLTASSTEGTAPARRGTPDGELAGSGLWAVSGGLGALGALSSRWLAASGVRHILLLGRSGLAEAPASKALTQPADDPAAIVAGATASGLWAAQVTLHKCDVAAAADPAGVLGGAAAESLALAGVLHAGGVLRDATLPNQTLPGEGVQAAAAAGLCTLFWQEGS